MEYLLSTPTALALLSGALALFASYFKSFKAARGPYVLSGLIIVIALVLAAAPPARVGPPPVVTGELDTLTTPALVDFGTFLWLFIPLAGIFLILVFLGLVFQDSSPVSDENEKDADEYQGFAWTVSLGIGIIWFSYLVNLSLQDIIQKQVGGFFYLSYIVGLIFILTFLMQAVFGFAIKDRLNAKKTQIRYFTLFVFCALIIVGVRINKDEVTSLLRSCVTSVTYQPATSDGTDSKSAVVVVGTCDPNKIALAARRVNNDDSLNTNFQPGVSERYFNSNKVLFWYLLALWCVYQIFWSITLISALSKVIRQQMGLTTGPGPEGLNIEASPNPSGVAPVAVATGDVASSLGGGVNNGDKRDQFAFLRRAFCLATFLLILPVVLSLAVCYVIFHPMVAEMNAAREEQTAVVRDLLAQTGKLDTERSQLARDALVLAKESMTSAAKLYSQTIKLRNEQLEEPNSSGLSKGKQEGGAVPSGKPFLVTPSFIIFGTGPNVDFGELTKEVVDASVQAGPKALREVIQGIGDGIDVARKTVDLTSDLVDLYRKFWPGGPGPLPGTLFDRPVNFNFDSSELTSEIGSLKLLAEKLRTSHTAVIIEGHTDGVGSSAYNEGLSQRRADAVKKFLLDNGVPENQFHTFGYGKGYLWHPYAPADAANRRVRIIECTVAGEDRCESATSVRRANTLRQFNRYSLILDAAL